MMIMQDPMLRMQYDAPGIFEYVAELGGAKNLTQFKMQAVPDQQLSGDANGRECRANGQGWPSGWPVGGPSGGGAMNAI